MTELEVLNKIYALLTNWFMISLLFQLMHNARRIINKWRKGQGIKDE
jgi:hypothetical protein